MRLLITGGGTGGHVYPALAVLEALDHDTAQAVAWVGGAESQGLERDLVSRQGIPYLAVRCGAIRGTGPWGALRGAADLARGVVDALGVLRGFRPDVVLSTGGFVSAPLVIAARLRRCPCLIYLPDIEPGLAIRHLSRWADRVAVSFEQAGAHFRLDKVVVTGYPVRKELLTTTKEDARRALGLAEGADAGLPVLLVMGGSRGARSINRAVQRVLPELLSLARVIHISGQADIDDLRRAAQALADNRRCRYHLHAYLHEEMAAALAAADLVVARAGAATLAEFPAVGLPAILVPYPYSGQFQNANAGFLAERGAAVVLPDGELEGRLLPTIQALLNDLPRRTAMSVAARQLSRPDAAAAIVGVLQVLASSSMGAKTRS
jgi:UDP-N-acetylglucosamine--N-acetylmuramyl-(pentapeptide) pyrophosphoryl-undecaprenol N-acetylglucosamine transferase